MIVTGVNIVETKDFILFPSTGIIDDRKFGIGVRGEDILDIRISKRIIDDDGVRRGDLKEEIEAG